MATKKSSLSTWFCLLLTVDVDGGFVVVVVHRKIGVGHYFFRITSSKKFILKKLKGAFFSCFRTDVIR